MKRSISRPTDPARVGLPARLLRASNALLGVVFPPTCSLCGSPADDQLFCPACLSAVVEARSSPACPRCGTTVARFEVRDGSCRSCRTRPIRIRGIARVAAYHTPVSPLLRSFKYHDRPHLGSRLADWLAESVRAQPWHDRIEALGTVPTHWTRHRPGSPYAAGVLARHLARRLNRPLRPLLKRVRGGPHQIGLSYTERVRNVAGAFAAAPGLQLDKTCILLVDDVMTTGATLEECGKMLRKSGGGEIYAAVITRVDWVPGTQRFLDVV